MPPKSKSKSIVKISKSKASNIPVLDETSNDEDLSKKYQKKTQLEHIRDLPDTYIGSIEEKQTIDYLLKLVNNKEKITLESFKFNPGLSNIIEEILVNAIDAYSRVNQKNKTLKGRKKLKLVTEIRININEETGMISIYNNGEGIDIAEHPEYKIYIPQMIFGELLTSGNYDKKEEKVTGGKNGYGAKLTNIYSTYFELETVDRIRKLKYKQIFRNNLDIKEEPEVIKYTKEPFTKISFIPDYKKFNLEKLSSHMIALLKKRAYDIVATTNGDVTVFFNDTQLSVGDFKDYMKLYFTEETVNDDEKEIIQPTEGGGSIEESAKGYENENFIYCKVNERWTIGACLSPSFGFKQVSFVNGINTTRGGRHVDYIVKQFTDYLVAFIQKKKKITVKSSIIKENIMVFVNATIVNPSFDSQTKETLTTSKGKFGSECIVPSKLIEELGALGVIEQSINLNKYQESQMLKKTDGCKKSTIRDIEKLEDAKYAGTKHSHKCTLILTEGDSAKAMAIAGLSVIENGRDYYGVMPLSGKLLNCRGDGKEKQFYSSKVIINLKRIIGLQENTVYTDISRLRYKKILIMTDQDVDGTHIKGLLMNFLSRWPSLMKFEGFISCLLTPIVKVSKKSKVISFYNLSDFQKWSEKNKEKGWHSKYYKGLGTSTPNEAKEYFRDFKNLVYKWEEENNKSDNSIDLAFNPKRADDRKTWLRGYDMDRVINSELGEVSICSFINDDLIHFSNYDNQRNIPSLCDGLKPSQRKILYCSQLINLTKEIRVSQLAGKVSEKMLYHHGEASLNGTIVNMAQNHMGSNNINLLVPKGQFGTRICGGKDSAQPRYIHTHLTNISSILFDKRDLALYDYVDDDGTLVEPFYYVPILPVILINGSLGIGTGWSTGVPKFNPLDIIKNIKSKMKGEEPKELKPWFRGFRGSIFKIDNNSWMTKGVYKIIGVDTIEITELPIGMWTENFKVILDTLIIDKKTYYNNPTTKTLMSYVKDYKNNSSESIVSFIIKFNPNIMTDIMDSYHNKHITKMENILKLTSKITCGNKLNLYNKNGRLTTFNNIQEIMDAFYDVRSELYEKRKAYLLKEMRKTLELIGIKVRFIMDIIDKKIIINNRSKSDINEQLEKAKYPKMVASILYLLIPENKKILEKGDYDFLIRMPIYNLTKEKIEELKKELNDIQTELNTLKSKTGMDLWLEDITKFEKDYTQFMKDYYKYMNYNPKDFIKTKRSMLIIKDRNSGD